MSLLCARVEAHTKLVAPMVSWESTLEEPVGENDIHSDLTGPQIRVRN